jgi:alanine racemase
LENIREGEPVVLLGEDRGEKITGDDLAGWAQTISYEIYLALGNANPRNYVGG